jgi:galactonate dehydratase
VANTLIGRDPRDIERVWADLYRSFDYQVAGGAELRALSAIDLALWDLLGKSLNAPVYRLIGGKANQQVRLYNTCFPYKYDLNREPEKIMRELIDTRGIRAIKIWPFDGAALAHDGLSISPDEMRTALEPIEKVRAAVGDRMDVMVELHALWKPGSAKAIARALEDYEPYWVEDAVKLDDMLAVSRFIDSTRLPCTFGETIGTRSRYYELLERCDLGYLMLDLGWCGGLSEAKKIAALAELHGVPIAPHDCTGPIGLTAGTHLAISTPNAVLQESVRAFYKGWYRDIVTELPPVADGFIAPPDAPGLGTALQPDLLERAGTRARRTRLEDL